MGESNHTFLELINIGTLLALLVHYRVKLVRLGRDVIEHKSYTLLRNILLTSIPAGLAGYLLADFITTNSFFGSIYVVVATLAVVGFAMIVLDRLPRASEVQDGEHLSWFRALVVGVAQMAALIPGVSRSGATIIAGRLSGLPHAQAADYSFLASIPIMLGVTLKILINSSDRAYFAEHFAVLVVGNIVAFAAGILAIRFLLGYLARHDLKLFGWYRLALAAVVGLVVLL